MSLVGGSLAICWVYCAALLRNFFLVEELTLFPDLAPTNVKLKVWYGRGTKECTCSTEDDGSIFFHVAQE